MNRRVVDGKSARSLVGSPVWWATLAFLLAGLWQFVTVRYNYESDFTALFHTGEAVALPGYLESEKVYRFSKNPGYDGMFYHLIAHDPFLGRGTAGYLDNPRLRYRRILIPGLAYILAFGRDQWIDFFYRLATLFFIGLGSYWLSRWSTINSHTAAWGLAFLTIPAVVVSVDRLTIDTALAALCIGSLLYSPHERCAWKHYALLSLAPLARETGLCLTLGHIVEALRLGDRKAFLYTSLTTVPFSVWLAFVHTNTARDGTAWIALPFKGIVIRTLNPIQYPLTGPWVKVAAGLDYLALLGIWLALWFAFGLLLRGSLGRLENSLLVFSFAILWLGKEDIWGGAYEFGRTMSPLIILLGLLAVSSKRYRYTLPLLCVLPRIALQLQPQAFGIIRALFS